MIARCRRRMNFYGRQRFQRDDLLIFCLALVQKHQQKQRQVQRERGNLSYLSRQTSTMYVWISTVNTRK